MSVDARQTQREPAVLARGVWHSYGRAASHARATLRGVDLDVEAGSFTCILGANGSGKTTFVRHLNALIPLQKGDLTVCGLDLSSDARNSWAVKSRCAMVFQSAGNQFVSSIVEEDVAFGPLNFGAAPDQAADAARHALEAVGLSGFEARDVNELSGGQRQRVALAGVLACSPDVVVLDEAGCMLDPQSRRDVLLAVREACEKTGAALIAVTHDLELAAAADKVVLFCEGKVAAAGAPGEVLAREDLLASAGLRAPVAVRTWRLLRERGAVPAGMPCPVTVEALAQAVSALCA